MTKMASYENQKEYYEYHGSTTIERIIIRPGNHVSRDWIIFDSVEEASEYFNCECGLQENGYVTIHMGIFSGLYYYAHDPWHWSIRDDCHGMIFRTNTYMRLLTDDSLINPRNSNVK